MTVIFKSPSFHSLHPPTVTNMNTLLHIAALASLALLLVPVCRPEFTVIMPDSSTLVDGPQTGFSSHARTDPGEQAAVYDIMEATGNGWARSIPDVCRGRWHGIECMPDWDNVYHVVSLSFGALSDDTAFPTCDTAHPVLSPSLLRLPYLRSLFFYRCFTGNPQPIPSFLGRLGPGLRSLVLRENGHIGPVPTELGNLTSLKILDLHGNNLGSSLPPSIGRLARLRLLDLSNNQLSSEIPELSFPSLTVLDLSHNRFQGRIPASIGKLEMLVKLDMSRNHLTGAIPDSLSYLKSLILLDLSHNWLIGPLPSSLGSLPCLRALVLKGNPMSSSSIPEEWFMGLKELETLVLSNMGLRGQIPESIAKLPSIRVLHLDGNELTGGIPRSLASLSKLRELRVNDNLLMGPIPFEREMLWRMGRKLRVHNNSRLCFDASNGRDEGMTSVFGIGFCESKTAAKMVAAGDAKTSEGKKVKHMTLLHWRSSAPPDNGGFEQVFLLMILLHLCVLPLLHSFL